MPSDEQNPRLLARPFTLKELGPERRSAPHPGPLPKGEGDNKRPKPPAIVRLGYITVICGAAGMVLTAIVKAIAAAALR